MTSFQKPNVYIVRNVLPTEWRMVGSGPVERRVSIPRKALNLISLACGTCSETKRRVPESCDLRFLAEGTMGVLLIPENVENLSSTKLEGMKIKKYPNLTALLSRFLARKSPCSYYIPLDCGDKNDDTGK